MEESFLFKGFQFAVPPTEVEYTHFMLLSDLLLRDMKSEKVHSKNLSAAKNKLLKVIK